MLIHVLKSKLKCVTVTSADTEYEGSITLDPLLMLEANIYWGERVEVNAKNGTSRIVTYAIPKLEGEGSGCVELNGGAANFFKKGDKVHINCYAIAEENEIEPAIVVKTDINNRRSPPHHGVMSS